MAKFVNSEESISSSLLLWNDKPTQVSIQETYNLKVWPITNILNEGPINFNIPSQLKGMMTDINVVTKLKIQHDGADITETQKSLSVVNNFANALWSLVDVKVDDRVDLTQSMKNAYVYSTFFNHALNSQSDREDYLFYNELFKMDRGSKKSDAENTDALTIDKDLILRDFNKKLESLSDQDIENNIMRKLKGTDDKLEPYTEHYHYAANLREFIKDAETKEKYWTSNFSKNSASGERARMVNKGQTITLSAKLQCPLFNTSKCLPTNMKVRVSLTKNQDKFLLIAATDSQYNIHIVDVYLDVTYYRPREQILQLIEDRLQKVPAPYFVSRPEIIIKPIPNSNRIIRLTDIFHDKIPAYAFFCLQKSGDFEGKINTNPFVFIPFKKFQFYVNGSPYFANPLEVTNVNDDGMYEDFGDYLRQLYHVTGRDLKGNCLINSSNFQLNFMVGMSFGADRSSITDKHLNLQEKASTYLEIDMGINETLIPDDMILITYAVFDRQIQIDGDRRVRIIE